MPRVPIAATVAGSDSGGGAGIQADLKSFAASGVYGVSVVVALTAQNTRGVEAVHGVPPDFVRAQFAALDGDLRPAAVKTGMLLSTELIQVVAEQLSTLGWGPLVVDPVMVAKSGDHLLRADAVDALRDRLLPLAEVLTPNWPEAASLSGLEVVDEGSASAAGRRLLEMGPRWVLVKGGHSPGPPTDLLMGRDQVVELRGTRVPGPHTHGTGCTFSAALTAQLARGRSVPEAAAEAKRYLQAALEQAPQLGGGHGPLQHLPRGWPE